MSNSKLVDYIDISPMRNTMSGKVNRKITIHHMAGNLSVETCGNVFHTRQASANYGIGSDGRVGMYVEEKDRSWASYNEPNDAQAVTIEVANDGGAPNWHVSDKALAKLIDLCVDVCQRNGIKKLVYTGDSTGNLTRHNMFTATTCPGPYLQGKFPEIAEAVNKQLGATTQPAADLSKYYTYTIQPGDTLTKIAKVYKTTPEHLAALNGIPDPNKIKAGKVIKVYGDAPAAKPSVQAEDKPTVTDMAWRIINGTHGWAGINGQARRDKLIANGWNADEVQARINQLLAK